MPAYCKSVPSAIASPILIPSRPIRRVITIIKRHLLLNLNRTPHCAVDAVEHDQRIAAGLDDFPTVFLDGRVDHLLPY